MPRFPLVCLTDLCDVLSGGTPSTKQAEYWNGGIPWASVKDFNTNSRWFSMTEKNITQEGLENCSSVLLEPGELILSARGTVGVVAQAGIRTAFNQSSYGLRAKPQVAENDYLYYALVNAKRVLLGDAHGGMFDTITRATLERLLVPSPPLTEQKRIAKTLGVFDEKIAVNHDLSQTLEAFAESIFKSWFIDFDPVKAKMAAQEPVGMDAETAALFPDSMEDSEMGQVPSGWSAQPLDSIAEYLNGLAMQKFPVVDDSDVLPVIKIAQLRAGHTRGADLASGALDPRFVIEDGDILFSWSGTLEVEYWTGGRGALNQHLFKVAGKTVPDWFAYFATRSFLGEFRAIASSKATTMGHIQRRHLTEALFAVPPNDVLEHASSFIGPIVSLRTDLLKQNTTLSKLRDSLLPRLISGELEMPDEMLAA
jgi:type I restriction enzyme, S subunit